MVLTASVLCLALAVFRVVPADTARAIALFAATGFTAIWGAFLVAGNHFSYHFGHEGSQNTHFQMTLWGMANMIFITV